jgi:hypothetical protein
LQLIKVVEVSDFILPVRIRGRAGGVDRGLDRVVKVIQLVQIETLLRGSIASVFCVFSARFIVQLSSAE